MGAKAEMLTASESCQRRDADESKKSAMTQKGASALHDNVTKVRAVPRTAMRRMVAVHQYTSRGAKK